MKDLIIYHGWELILLIIVIYVLIGNKLVAISYKIFIKKTLSTTYGDINELINKKIIELNYEKTFEEMLDSKYKMNLYCCLAIIGIMQSIIAYYVKKSIDLMSYEVALFTVVIAVLEAKSNYNLNKEKKNDIKIKSHILIEYNISSCDDFARQREEKFIEEKNKLTKFEILFIFYTKIHFRKISIKDTEGNNHKLHATIQSGHDETGKFVSIIIKEKIKYLPNKLRDVSELQIITDRSKDVLVYTIPGVRKKITIEIPY